jgi:hypothetical protein
LHNILDGKDVPLHKCFQILNGILASVILRAVLDPPKEITKTGFVTRKLSEFATSHGWDFYVSRSFFSVRSTSLFFTEMEEKCNVRFDNLKQKWDMKKVHICVRNELSSIHESYLQAPQPTVTPLHEPTPTATVSPETAPVNEPPETAPVDEPPESPLTRTKLVEKSKTLLTTTTSLQNVTRNQEKQAQRDYKTVEPAINEVADQILTILKNKRSPEAQMALQLRVIMHIEHLFITIFPNLPPRTNNIDTRIVNNIASFLGLFQTKGTRTAPEQQIVSSIFACITSETVSQKELQERLGVKMRVTTEASKNNRLAVFNNNLNALITPQRKTRADKIDIGWIREIWENNICFARLDTFQSKLITCRQIDGTVTRCPRKVQQEPSDALYEVFLATNEYMQFQQTNFRRKGTIVDGVKTFIDVAQTVSFALFMRARCKCISRCPQLDCADEKQVALFQCLVAWTSLRRKLKEQMKACGCVMHLNPLYAELDKGLEFLCAFVQCPPIEYLPMCYDCFVPNEVENEVIKYRKIAANTRQAVILSTKQQPLTGQFRLERGACVNQACGECGVLRNFLLVCPHDNTATETVKLLEFQLVSRNIARPSKQKAPGREKTEKELVSVEVTGQQLMLKIHKCLKDYLPHRWHVRFDLQNRRRLLNMFKSNRIVIMTDFSANYDCDPGQKLNSATSEHAILDVFIVCHSPVTVEGKRNIQCDTWFFWGKKREQQLSNDCFFHGKCLQHIIRKYQALPSVQPFSTVTLLTDGCPQQYKCRKHCSLLATTASKYNVTMEHVVAPTAAFKTIVDGEGKVAKALMRRLERESSSRAGNPRKVFEEQRAHMPHEVPPSKNPQLMEINKRFQRLVIHPSDELEGDRDRDDILMVDFAQEKYDCKPLEAAARISTRFMFRATPAQGEAKQVQFKTLPCWCNDCLDGNFAQCQQIAITGPFSTHNIVATLAPTAENNVQAAIIAEEEALELAYNAPVADPAAMAAEVGEEEEEEREEIGEDEEIQEEV